MPEHAVVRGCVVQVFLDEREAFGLFCPPRTVVERPRKRRRVESRLAMSAGWVVLEIGLLVFLGESEGINDTDVEDSAHSGALIFLRECWRCDESAQALAVKYVFDILPRLKARDSYGAFQVA